MANSIKDYLAGLNAPQAASSPNMSYMPLHQMMQAQASQLPDPPQEQDQFPDMPEGGHFSGVNPQILKMLRPPAYIKPPDLTDEKALVKQYTQHSEEGLKQEGAGIDQLQSMLNNYQQTPRGIDWTPLAAYIDSISGGHLTEAAKEMRPESPQEKQARILNLQTMIQERKGAMSQRDLGALGEQIANMKANAQLEQSRQSENASLGMQYNGVLATLGKMSMGSNNLTSREQTAADRFWNNDKILNQYVPRLDGAQKILNQMDAAGAGEFKTNKQLMTQISLEIGRLEAGSQAVGEHTIDGLAMKSKAADLSAIKDSIFNQVSSVPLDQQFAQARGQITDLGRSILDQVNKRGGTIMAGARPSQLPIYQAKHAQVLGSYKDVFGGGGGGQAHQGSSQGTNPSYKEGDTHVENGVTFKVVNGGWKKQ